MLLLSLLLAAHVKIQLVLVAGQNSLSFERGLEAFSGVQEIYKNELGADLEIVKLRKIGNPFKRHMSLDQRALLLRKWTRWFSRRRRDPMWFNVAVIPPLIDQGKYYIAGYANGECVRRHGVAWANAEEKNHLGNNRFYHSIIAIAHEIGHLGGMRHVYETGPEFTIMNPAALTYVVENRPMHFNEYFSKRQWRSCIGE